MKLKIKSGYMDVDVYDGIEDVRRMLREKPENEEVERDKIRNAGFTQDINTLNPRTRMPI